MFLTIVLPGIFVMARRECCREIETATFAACTNLPVSDFQTWQVCFEYTGISWSKGQENLEHEPIFGAGFLRICDAP